MAPPPNRMETDNTAVLSVTGWTNSKASAGSADRGASSLVDWVQKKAQRSIRQWTVQGDALVIEILGRDKRSFFHIDGWRWAGIDVKISEGTPSQSQSQPPRGPRNQPQPIPSGPRNQANGFGSRGGSQGTDLASRISGSSNNNSFNNNNNNSSKELFGQQRNDSRGGFGGRNNNQSRNGFNQPKQDGVDNNLKQVLIDVVRKRYNAAEKFLDFSALATDPDIQAAGLQATSAEKVFQAIFSTCETVFETWEKRRDMVQSLSFSKNALTTVRDIIAAASTFSRIKNLDLSDNNFSEIRALTWWKKRFPDLEQIILSGNPVDGPQTREEVKRWYRNLRTYNMQPLDAPWAGGPQQLEINPPAPTSSPAPTEPHPEFGPGSTFGMPQPGKPQEQLLKEQMGLKFSFETHLKMIWVEECLQANNWNYDAAIEDVRNGIDQGKVPADAFLQV